MLAKVGGGDPGNTGRLTLKLDWGDASTITGYPLAGGSLDGQHPYRNDNPQAPLHEDFAVTTWRLEPGQRYAGALEGKHHRIQ